LDFTDAEIATEANLQSRGKKRKDLTMEDLRADVEEQLSKVDTSLDGLLASAQKQSENAKELLPTFGSLDEIFDIAMRDVTEQQSAFKKEEFLLHCMKLGLGDYSGQEILRKFDEKIKDKEILAMPGETGIYTTQKMVDIEKSVIDSCKQGVGQSAIKVDKEKALNFIETTDVKLKIGNSFKKSPQELQKIFENHASVFPDETKTAISKTFETSDKDKFRELYNGCDENQKAVLKEFISVAGYGFTPGQRDAIELIASTSCQFSVIQGDAGTGKSFSMNFAREMLEADGFIVRGFAPTGKASVELSNSAKIKGCQTIDKFLIDGALKQPVSHEEFLEARKEVDRLIPLLKSQGSQSQGLLKRYRLTKAEVEKMQDYQIEAKILKHDRKLNTALTSPVKDKEVWIIDESGMAGSAKYLNVIESAKKSGAKCIFVGDRKQFASIEAGKMFQEMQDKTNIDKVIMPDVMRQKTEQTKQIVSAISMREMDFAFDMMKGRKQITEKLDDINSYQVEQMIYFHEDIKNRKGDILAVAGSSAKVIKINEDGSLTLGIYDNERNENVDTNFKLAKIANKISVYESVHENIISQETDRNERLDNVVEDYMVNTERQIKNNSEKLFDTMIITATNKDRSALNQKIRKELKDSQIPEMKVSGDFEFSVLEANSLGGTAKSIADSYEIGNRMQIDYDFAKQYGIDQKQLGTIVGIDKTKNEMIVQFPSKNPDAAAIEVKINPSIEEFSAFRENVKPFGINDKIVFLKNDNNVNVRNGQLAIIREINENGDVVADMSGEKVRFNLNEYRNVDHAYCLSEYKSQGATVSRLVWHADTKSGDVSSNSFYVAITRCTHEIALYTDDVNELQEKVKEEQYKYSTVDLDFYKVENMLKADNVEKKKIFDINSIDMEFDTEKEKTTEKVETIEKE
jgi:ATP-dependent exoDNAse (exonuclease V) alpha subunit